MEIFNVDAADGSLSLNQTLELPPDRDDALTSSRGRGDTACMEYRWGIYILSTLYLHSIYLVSTLYLHYLHRV